jgi:hypothetical protein
MCVTFDPEDDRENYNLKLVRIGLNNLHKKGIGGKREVKMARVRPAITGCSSCSSLLMQILFYRDT